jgi:hypothetical protein
MDSTNFANSKKRMIRKSAKGSFFVMTAAGAKSYGPKAAFRKNASGSLVRLVASNSVPAKIAPAKRAVRKNKGVARGPREGTLQRRMNAESRRLAAKGPRKVRKNKGVKRGARSKVQGIPAGRNPFAMLA